MRTILSCVAAARTRLRDAGVPDIEAELDARLLAQRALGWDAARLLASANEPASDSFLSAYNAYVARRANREPMAYILGTQEFWDLTFEVTPAVLIPRPETEIIVEATLQLFPDADAAVRIADVGTGSGCLAVAIAHERRHALLVATDLSAEALEVAGRNAQRHDVDGRITFAQGDLLPASLMARLQFHPLDLIVSNPPYVAESDRPSLQPEVRDYEPPAALFGGLDGLTVITRLVGEAASQLRPGGYLIFEIGIGQEEPVRLLISSIQGLTMIDLRRDLQGIPRTVIAQRAF